MKIRIISDYRGLFFIDVPEYISVFELKQKLLDEKGIYLGDEPLLCNGMILSDEDTLKDNKL